jgi:hypothetical protein
MGEKASLHNGILEIETKAFPLVYQMVHQG